MKHTDDEANTAKDVAPTAGLAFFDGTRPIWIRKSAVVAFHPLGEPAVSFRILLLGGEVVTVNWSEAVKDALLDAIK